jgi:ABC-type spermidine/putrescine transport system permease subunit II
MNLSTIALATTVVTAAVGAFVASLAYRGYRRNGSETMRALAVGVALIAVVPVFVTGLSDLAELSDASVLFVVLLSHTLGLLAVYRSLD